MNELLLRLRAVPAALLISLLAGCGGADPGGSAPTDDSGNSLPASGVAEEAPATGGRDAPAAASPDVAQTFVLSAADVAAYERGLRREVEMLEAAEERLNQAERDEDRLEILGNIQPQELRRDGAAAAELAEERYELIANVVNDVLGKLDMGEATRQMMPSEEDLAEMPPEVRERVEENVRQMQAAFGDPYEGLDRAAAAALEARVDEIRRLRAEHLGLLLNVAR